MREVSAWTQIQPGRRFAGRLPADLPPGVDRCGERGAFHSPVSAGPIFRRRIDVQPGEVVFRDDAWHADLLAASCVCSLRGVAEWSFARRATPNPSPSGAHDLHFWRSRTILVALGLLAGLPGTAQVLARPGWAGSGVAPEAWWKRAVFYRIDPARFQDSDGDGAGDLQGIVQRLDYLQSVGVDALLLDGPFDSEALGDLVREASQHHLRVIVAIDDATAHGPHEALLNKVHGWLGAGAAGLCLPKSGESDAENAAYASLVGALRQMLRSFPGDRVLLSDPVPLSLPPRPAPAPRRGEAAPPAGAQLITAGALPVASAGVTQLRAAFTAATQSLPAEQNGLLRFAQDPATDAPNTVADAALLLASRDAAVFDFGNEIGLDTFPLTGSGASAPPKALPVMQWTPANHTAAPAERTEKTTTPGSETEFGAYHPYQPPPRGLAGPAPAAPRVAVDANVPAALPEPDTLPGFTSGTLPAEPINGARLNVTTQDRDPRSILNAYRALIGLHHDNAALRNGAQYVLNRDADGALVWLRRAPVGSRTAANVVVAANLTDKPVLLSLDAEIEALGMRGGALRPLLAYSREALTGETTGHLALPPHAVLVGEIVHSGALESEPVAHARGGRRHSRHRVRR